MSTSILVVEDEPAIQELLRLNLEDAGFTVHTVADAESAQAQINAALPDLILLDWMLPGQSGLAFARILRGDARTRELPIIMVTARSDEADRISGLEAWVDHVYIEERTIDVHIRRLRHALEPHGIAQMLETVRGSGYRLAAQK